MAVHLTLRVAWHEQKWDGTVCKHPSHNSFCLLLDRIREDRDDAAEDLVAGKSFETLKPHELPACKAEAGAFMNSKPWVREFNHPYQKIPKAQETHGHLKSRKLTVPPYTTFAVPFWWMLRDNQKGLQQMFKEELPPDEDPPFPSSWVFGRARQERINQYFFDRIKAQSSLVFFYCKEGQPIGEEINRLVIGVGQIEKVGNLQYYESSDPNKKTYPLWDRMITHSIRTDGVNGFLLPYHEYLRSTGDIKEDERRHELLREIAVAVPGEYMRAFSYMAEHANSDVALSILLLVLKSVKKIKEHGIAKGPWEEREEWLNSQISRLWKERGAFPGIGSAMETIGLRLGTAIIQELYEAGWLTSEENPWVKLGSLLSGFTKARGLPLSLDLKPFDNVRSTYNMLEPNRVALLHLLSRFSLTTAQMKRWFEPEKRPANYSDEDILKNPYLISEFDQGDELEGPIAVGIIDRGLLPEASIASKHPVPEPSAINGYLDPRRGRSVIVTVLREAAENGDTFLSQYEVLERIAKVNLVHPCEISGDWINGNLKEFAGVVERLNATIESSDSQAEKKQIPALQLVTLKMQEDNLRKVFHARARKAIPSTQVDWKTLILTAIKNRNYAFDSENKRHIEALNDQAIALEKITTHKLSVLTGRAGTGKTAALGALFHCDPLVKGGILLLAPTGKARVRLGKAANSEAKTVAQFLSERGRWDGKTNRPLFFGKDSYAVEKTVVIDECSMLTMDDFFAVFQALDLGHVQRIILVGDPNQLPPIGTGRPFADLCVSFESASLSDDPTVRDLAHAYGRLTVEVRTKDNRQSDTLRLASWFTREPQLADADKVFSDLELGVPMNDLDIQFWEDPDELRNLMFSMFQKHLDMKSPDDVEGFNRALGINNGKLDFSQTDGAENFQILSPVRMHPYGVYDLNRLIQRQFRKEQLSEARRKYQLSLGDEEISLLDKVIQLKNRAKKAYNYVSKEYETHFIANGEVGIIGQVNSPYLSVLFAGRPSIGFSYAHWDFLGGSGPLELAYALTVHKSQGSEFETTFIILPKKSRLMTRELLYTAMTRSRKQLVLLAEGKQGDMSFLYEFTRPESSEVARRNTNLFRAVVRVKSDEPPYAEHLIHKTEKGHMVRSKSELVIANKLFQLDLPYEYERPYELPELERKFWPDFRFTDPSGDTIIWEHLGMLHKDDYRESWERKLRIYNEQGFQEGVNLFTTRDDERGGLDSNTVVGVAEKIKSLI
jgi:ATP-dependent exoDNAse (exonuclease V) alpha subunit